MTSVQLKFDRLETVLFLFFFFFFFDFFFKVYCAILEQDIPHATTLDLSYDFAVVIQWIASCLINPKTTPIITLWRVTRNIIDNVHVKNAFPY